MHVGEKVKFYIPSELAYGAKSPSPAIPANSALIFEVELLAIAGQEAAPANEQAAEEVEATEEEAADNTAEDVTAENAAQEDE